MHSFYFKPESGQMTMEDPFAFKTCIQKLRDRRHVITIKEYFDKRSNGANKYYWGIVIAYFLGESGQVDSESNKQIMHDRLGLELRMIDDELRPGKRRVQGTSEMDASQFWKYIWRCELFFRDWFATESSFPPPKSRGYDEGKL